MGFLEFLSQTFKRLSGQESAQLKQDLAQITSERDQLIAQKLRCQSDPVTSIVPFLDQTKTPYLPIRQYVNQDQSIAAFNFSDPREIFVTFRFQDNLVQTNNWKSLTKHQKLLEIWKYVCNPNNRVYKSDYRDNWQFAIETDFRKAGDCEDSSIFFITFAKAAGIPETDVFLAVGPTNFGYHAYPIVYYSSDDATAAFGDSTKSGWYIFESTLSFAPAGPKALKGSEYWIDNGLQNWEYFGQIKTEYQDAFNGTPKGNPGDKIENSNYKIDKIEKYWRENNGI